MKGVEYASRIAAALNAKMILLHVVKQKVVPDSLRDFAKAEGIAATDIDLLKRGAQFLLAAALDKARAAGVKDVSVEVAEGPIARTLVALADEHEMDLVVVGSRGMGDLEGVLRGGVSHRVEILAKCPVLVVK